MDMYHEQNDIIEENPSQAHDKKNHHISHRIFTTNWGLAVIGGLIALAIGVSMIHNGHVESRAEFVPEAEQETVSILPLS